MVAPPSPESVTVPERSPARLRRCVGAPDQEEAENPARDPEQAMSRAVTRSAAWGLFATTVVLVPLAVVLTALAVDRDPDLGDGWQSRLLLAGLGGASALLFAAVGVLIARVEPHNAIGWIFLGSAAL